MVASTHPVELAARPVGKRRRAASSLSPPPPPVHRDRRPSTPPGGGRLALLRGIALACVAGSLIAVGRSAGAFDGLAGLGIAVLLVLLVPTSREFTRRVLYAGCFVLGLVPVLWWWDIPVDGIGRATVGLVLLAAGLGLWVGIGARPSERARTLLPRVRGVDLVLPATVGLGTWTLWPWLVDTGSAGSLTLLLRGYDHVAHFSMVHTIRLRNVTVDALPPPAGGRTWQFASYPEGFHSAVAGVQELLAGPVTGDLAAELLGYTRGVAIVVIAVTVTVVAGLAALPALRRRPAVAAPVGALAATVLLLGPGGASLGGGFGNFVLACGLVLAAFLVAVPMPRVVLPVPLAALGAAVVGVANSWVLLVLLVVPAAIAVLLPPSRRRWATTPERVVVVVILGAAVGACLDRIVDVVLRVQAADPLLIPGGISVPDLGLVLASGVALVVGALAVRRARVACLALVPLLGAAVAVPLAVAQIAANGQVSYYGFKLLTALAVVLPVLALVPPALLLARRRPGPPGRRALAAVGLSLAATQVFGLAAPDGTEIGLAPGAPGAAQRAGIIDDREEPPSVTDLAERIEARGPATDRPVYYLDLPTDGRIGSILAAQWYLALTDTWTLEANGVISDYVQPEYGDEYAAATARRILTTEPDAVVAVRPAGLRRLVETLDSPELARRIVTF